MGCEETLPFMDVFVNVLVHLHLHLHVLVLVLVLVLVNVKVNERKTTIQWRRKGIYRQSR